MGYEEARDILLEDIDERGYTEALIKPNGILDTYLKRMVDEGLVVSVRVEELDERGLHYSKIFRK